MTRVTTESAELRLRSIGLVLGDWNRVVDTGDVEMKKRHSITVQVPTDAEELFVFSLHLADSIPLGDWLLICFDNSTFFPKAEELVFNSHFNSLHTETYFPILFDVQASGGEGLALLSHVLFLLLLFKAHAQLVSPAALDGQMIHLEDGAVFISSRSAVQFPPAAWLVNPDRRPLELPTWAVNS